MFMTLLLVIHTLIAAGLVAVILMQRSEGGGLGMGGSPSGLMSARGAADFLTRATTVLGGAFILTSIGLAVLASVGRAPHTVDTSLAGKTGAPTDQQAAPPPPGDPLKLETAPAAPAQPAQQGVPLAN